MGRFGLTEVDSDLPFIRGKSGLLRAEWSITSTGEVMAVLVFVELGKVPQKTDRRLLEAGCAKHTWIRER